MNPETLHRRARLGSMIVRAGRRRALLELHPDLWARCRFLSWGKRVHGECAPPIETKLANISGKSGARLSRCAIDTPDFGWHTWAHAVGFSMLGPSLSTCTTVPLARSHISPIPLPNHGSWSEGTGRHRCLAFLRSMLLRRLTRQRGRLGCTLSPLNVLRPLSI